MWIFAIFSGAGIVMYALSRNKKRKRLPNSTKIVAKLRINVNEEDLVMYLPSSDFMVNMDNAVLKVSKEITEKWKSNSDLVFRSWNKFTYTQKKRFVSKLLLELNESVLPYSDTSKLSSVLCPDLDPEFLLSDKGTDGKNGVDRFMDAISVDKIHILVGKVHLVTASALSGDVDPNRESIINKELFKSTRKFIEILRNLCLVMFAKQFLERHAAEPARVGYNEVFQKMKISIFLMIVAVLVALALEQTGVLQNFFWGFPNLAN